MIKKIIVEARSIIADYYVRKSYYKLYASIYRVNPIFRNRAIGEELWLQKWRKVDSKVRIDSYRIFSRFIGPDINIVPLEFCAACIEPLLDPKSFWAFYNDKNMFDKLFGQGILPTTLLRNIDGFFYDINYKHVTVDSVDKFISEYHNVIIKPTIGGESGKNVKKIDVTKGLDINFLNTVYNKNYIIQECLKQHPFLSQFNATSVNTIRIMTYRSVKDNNIFVLNAILRVGAQGKDVDNAHAGGKFCGISFDGILGNYVCNYLGESSTTFNGIDYSKHNYEIPNFDIVKEFAKKIAEQVVHHRLLALDIMIDEKGKPMLIEINVGGFSAWLFQFTTGSAFGSCTNEIIDYLSNAKNN